MLHVSLKRIRGACAHHMGLWCPRNTTCAAAACLGDTCASAVHHSGLQADTRLAAQVYCYEDSKLLKLFQAIVRTLYDVDVLGEDTILWWFKKGAHPKGRNVFQRDMEPFVKWLEEAEAEEEDDED